LGGIEVANISPVGEVSDGLLVRDEFLIDMRTKK
jgi:hypothetical protein